MRLCKVASARVLTGVFLATTLTLMPLDEASANAREDQIKAAVLYEISKMTTWPASSTDSDLVICFMRDNSLFEAANTIEGLLSNGRTLALMKINNLRNIDDCAILVFGASDPKRMKNNLRIVSDKPVLTVGSDNSFMEHGGTIRLFVKNNRVGFAVNENAAVLGGLELDPKLLSAADSVVSI